MIDIMHVKRIALYWGLWKFCKLYHPCVELFPVSTQINDNQFQYQQKIIFYPGKTIADSQYEYIF